MLIKEDKSAARRETDMTMVAVLADPPVEGVVLDELTPDPLSPGQAAELYGAMLADICGTIQQGKGDLLVNYRPSEQVPADVDSEKRLRDLLDEELPDAERARYEPQVGQTYAGRVGNTLTHLLETEGEETVAVVEPTAAFLRRDHVGSAMMKLRTNEVVLGPAPGGRVALAAFDDPIDFEDAYATPAVETLTARGLDAGLDVEFISMTPLVETPADLTTAVALLRARTQAGRIVPPRTAALIERWGLTVDDDGTVSPPEP